MISIKRFTQIGTMIAFALFASACATAQPSDDYLVSVNDDHVILQGYDTVAFFTQDRAVQGTEEYKSVYHGAVYYFDSASNQSLFDADPERYQPQFGGHCSMAMSMGKLEAGDVSTWSIVDGRLIVQRNVKAEAMWAMNPTGNLSKADGNWPRLVKENGKRG